MNVRTELAPIPPDPVLVAELSTIADEIMARLNSAKEYDSLVDRFNAIAALPEPLTISDFEAFWESVETEDFVRGVLCSYPNHHDDVTDAEYLEIIRTLRSGRVAEYEVGYWKTFIEINLRCRSITELLFRNRDLTDEEVLINARANRPIAL